MPTAPKILLTFDVEEFDLPLEYNQPIEMVDQMRIGKLGLDAVSSVIDKHQIECTLFTTANFAQQYPSEIKALSATQEIASHTFYHSAFETADLLKSRQALEAITLQKVTGLRMPRMKKIAMKDVIEAGYQYDSSINPTLIPGRYNNLHLSRTLYTEEKILRLPVSVSPHLRIPLFWLSFKNMPYWLFKKLAIQTLKNDGYLSLYFHPWEFTDISQYKVPAYTKSHSGIALLNRLDELIIDLKKEGEFVSISSMLQNSF